MTKTLALDFCDMTIYDHYLVVVMKEGIDVTPDYNDVLVKIAHTYFPEKPFVYITHRLNSYSVDPKIYLKTVKIENLKGFAVVSANYQSKINAQIEQLFFNKPFQIFTKLNEAVNWAEALIETSSKTH